jgi:hypothetical protein
MYAIVAPVAFLFSELQLAFDANADAPVGAEAFEAVPVSWLVELAAVAAVRASASPSAATAPILVDLIVFLLFRLTRWELALRDGAITPLQDRSQNPNRRAD